MRHHGLETCEFDTDRLRVATWHSAEDDAEVDLADVVAAILTKRSTTALPPAWQGDFSIERANAWIRVRDAESPTLLVTELATGRALGLVILYGVALDDATIDVRVGYVIAEAAWGQGFATELVAGLVAWATTQPSIKTLTGGVDAANRASARVLIKNDFELIAESEREATYQRAVAVTSSEIAGSG